MPSLINTRNFAQSHKSSMKTKTKKISVTQARQIMAIVDVGLRQGPGKEMKAA